VKYLYFYPEKCTGCRLCSLSCSVSKFGEANPKRAGITIVRDEFDRYEIQFACLQCDDPECVAACRTGAMHKDEDGIVRVNEDKCIGCRMCVIACPYAAIISHKGKIVKCDLCGGDPQCIHFCSTNAITYEEENKEIVDRRKELAEILLKK
jgi:Fe-S-cluster-containing dehydrogenase component